MLLAFLLSCSDNGDQSGNKLPPGSNPPPAERVQNQDATEANKKLSSCENCGGFVLNPEICQKPEKCIGSQYLIDGLWIAVGSCRLSFQNSESIEVPYACKEPWFVVKRYFSHSSSAVLVKSHASGSHVGIDRIDRVYRLQCAWVMDGIGQLIFDDVHHLTWGPPSFLYCPKT